MPTVLKSVLVPKPARTMFDLVYDVESFHGLASGRVFGHIIETLVGPFVARAEALS